MVGCRLQAGRPAVECGIAVCFWDTKSTRPLSFVFVRRRLMADKAQDPGTSFRDAGPR